MFFTYFPRCAYTFLTNGQPYQLALTDIRAHVKVMETVKARITAFHDYLVSEGERPDTVATKVYGSPDYTWLVLSLNNIFTLFDWPLDQTEFDAYIAEKYGSVAAAQAQKVYYTTDGYRVDYATWLTLSDERGQESNAYDMELELNEAKRRIKVVPAEFIAPLMSELKKVML